MAGRIRSLKPEILESGTTARLSDGAFRLFVGMIALADDYGNLRAAPAQLAGSVFWAQDPAEALAKVSRGLRECLAAKLITVYEAKGQPHAHLNGWGEHQKVDHPGKPRCPGPQDPGSVVQTEMPENPRETLARDSRTSRESLGPDRDRDQDRDQSNEQDREEIPARVTEAGPPPHEPPVLQSIPAPIRLRPRPPDDWLEQIRTAFVAGYRTLTRGKTPSNPDMGQEIRLQRIVNDSSVEEVVARIMNMFEGGYWFTDRETPNWGMLIRRYDALGDRPVKSAPGRGLTSEQLLAQADEDDREGGAS